MGQGERDLFYAALRVIQQPLPRVPYPFYAFPQVSLGQIVTADSDWADWPADRAHRAINSKRCDLLIADRYGTPIAVLEYQGAAHDIDGTAAKRDEIKRLVLEAAGVRYIEIADGTSQPEIEQAIRKLLNTHVAKGQPTAKRAAATQYWRQRIALLGRRHGRSRGRGNFQRPCTRIYVSSVYQLRPTLPLLLRRRCSVRAGVSSASHSRTAS